ncbi:aldo/keto reductase [Arthrobacter sp. HLT1-20]
MKSNNIVGSAVHVTELGFGAAGLGNLQTSITDADAAQAVEQAWTEGIRYFDTAPHYGLGLSERRLGAALGDKPRDEFVVSTKVGRLLLPHDAPTERDNNIFEVPGDFKRVWDFSRDGILRSVEASLERLGLDRIDILYLHDPDVSGDPNATQTGAKALIELREQGVLDAVGIGSNSSAAVVHAFKTTDIDTAMLAGRYTLLERHGADEVFAAAGERSVIMASPFNSGILARPRPLPGAFMDYAPAPASVLAEANRLADLAERFGGTLPQAALQFPLRPEQVASVVVGMRRAPQVTSNVELLGRALPDEFWHSLTDFDITNQGTQEP